MIGPSSVGKSTLGKYAEMFFSNCRHYNLDALVKISQRVESISGFYNDVGKDEFLRFCEEEVEQFSADCEDEYVLCLFDVGAGGMQSDNAGAWVNSRTAIAVICSPERLYERYQNRHIQSFENFKSLEYSARHQEIYLQTAIRLTVTDLDEDAAKQKFVELLEENFPFLVRRTNP